MNDDPTLRVFVFFCLLFFVVVFFGRPSQLNFTSNVDTILNGPCKTLYDELTIIF